MANLLAYLHDGSPEIFSFDTMAIVAHLIVNYKLHYERLLKEGSIHHLFLYGQLDLETLRMRLRPNESGVNQSYLKVIEFIKS